MNSSERTVLRFSRAAARSLRVTLRTISTSSTAMISSTRTIARYLPSSGTDGAAWRSPARASVRAKPPPARAAAAPSRAATTTAAIAARR